MTHPADDGFRLPADWAPHSRCWMAWPVRSEAWGEHLGQAREAVGEVAEAIARFEPVTMIAKTTKVAEVSLLTASGVSSFSLPQDDSWLRDNGPSFVTSGTGHVAGVQWRWNAWGGRYTEVDGDAMIPEKMLEQLSMRRYQAPLVFEGSAVMTDGEGTLIANERMILDPKRNPGLQRAEAPGNLEELCGEEDRPDQARVEEEDHGVARREGARPEQPQRQHRSGRSAFPPQEHGGGRQAGQRDRHIWAYQ